MPVYNAVPFLEAAITSVLSQQGTDFELIAVNDASTDGSGAVLDRFAGKANFRRLDLDQNLGQSAALNHGLAVARGTWVKFFDADDLMSPGHLAAQVASLRGTTRHLSACAWAGFRGDPAKAVRREAATDRDYNDPVAWILDSLELDEGMMPGWRWLIPREVLDKAGGWDERLSLNNDFEFSIRLLLHSEGVRFAPAASLLYRQAVAGSLSKRLSSTAMASAWLTTRLGCEYLLSRDSGPRARRLCADRMQDWHFRFYPKFPHLASAAETEIKALGGSGLAFPGGQLGRQLSRILPWKAVRQLQAAAGACGWDRVQKMKAALRAKG